MVPNFVITFRHELVSSVLISVLLAAVAWPFRKLKSEWIKATLHLDSITTELTETLSAFAALASPIGITMTEPPSAPVVTDQYSYRVAPDDE